MNIVITGASRGIGKSIAGVFAAVGHQLFLTSRNDISLYKTVEELSTKFPSSTIKAKPFDVSNKNDTIALGKWINESTDAVDILVNNAGTFQPGNVSDEPDEALENQIATNLYSAYHLTRALLPKMIARKSGHIFNMCSIASLHAYPNGGAYSISKFAMDGFSKNLRQEMKPHGIKVTSVYPGAVFTDSWAGYDNSNGRIMEAIDIAKLVYSCSLLSPQACVEEIVIRPQLGDL